MKKFAFPLVISAALLVAGCGDKTEVGPATAPASAATTTVTEPAPTTAAAEESRTPRETDIDLDEGLDISRVAGMSAAERESNFLGILDQQQLYVGSDETQLEVAAQTCAQLETMSEGDDIVPYGLELVDRHGISEYDAGKFIGLSAVFFCPDSMTVLGY